MADINTRKRGEKWEYYFEIARSDGKRKRISKGGFPTKTAAVKAGSEAYNEYNNVGQKFAPSEISVVDYLNYWLNIFLKTVEEGNLDEKEKYDKYLEYDIYGDINGGKNVNIEDVMNK